ncbi:MAG: response regulator transcription factor [Lewinellaceae bacterium]|nr:response regulator transcription factor [Lewinellaceae bacterium]
METSVKVILADDHQLVRKGFSALLDGLGNVTLLGEAANGRELLELLRRGARPDVVLLDCEMPVMNGLEALEAIKSNYFGIKVIMLTMLNSKDIIQSAVDKGANGFLFKNTSPSELSEALHKVTQGENYFSADVTMALLKPRLQPGGELLAQLSEREIEVLRLVAQGFSSTEIGNQLFISPRTVDTHRNNLIQKLQVPGIAGLVKFAIQHHLI